MAAKAPAKERDILKEYDHAYKMVGRFLHEFAHAEHRLNKVIEAAFKLSAVQSAIIGANVFIGTKLQIALAAVSVAGLPKRQIAKHTDALSSFWQLIADRNIIAHHRFHPTDDGKATEFFVVEAKGKVEMPTIVWGPGDFHNRFNRFEQLRKRLDGVATALGGADARRRIARALMEPPIPGTVSPGAPGLGAALPIPGSLYSGIGYATPGTMYGRPLTDEEQAEFEKKHGRPPGPYDNAYLPPKKGGDA